ncbi:hypothetical protein [Aneurinibacillus danicus]|jgi:hypothetical protein|uniref:Uncharacterized protein n=1 Tax=Aneurinibacillus danicus TaxID=267746 RepID=A0A511VCM7_9BACL|nr:hypothetical protein [Aneurinibacillus danicus]GEN36650.1 hypothetical protein ADA01nite_41100 [Aneurinibacillus danicus]
MNTATMDQHEYIVVCTPNWAGEVFLKKLQDVGQPFFVLVRDKEEEDYLRGQGYTSVLKVEDINVGSLLPIFDYPIGKIIIFEDHFFDCCSLIRIIRSLTRVPIYLVTPNKKRLAKLYYNLGVSHVIYSDTGNVSFLIN